MDDFTPFFNKQSTYKDNLFKDIDQDSCKLSKCIRLLKPIDDRFSNTIENKLPKKNIEQTVLVRGLMKKSATVQIREECYKDCKRYARSRLD